MSRAATNAGLLALIKRRTYSTAAAAARKTAEPKPTPASSGSKAASPEPPSSWVPDPVTGCYRPGNRRVEVDAAKMRETLLPRGGSGLKRA